MSSTLKASTLVLARNTSFVSTEWHCLGLAPDICVLSTRHPPFRQTRRFTAQTRPCDPSKPLISTLPPFNTCALTWFSSVVVLFWDTSQSTFVCWQFPSFHLLGQNKTKTALLEFGKGQLTLMLMLFTYKHCSATFRQTFLTPIITMLSRLNIVYQVQVKSLVSRNGIG